MERGGLWFRIPAFNGLRQMPHFKWGRFSICHYFSICSTFRFKCWIVPSWTLTSSVAVP